MRKNIIHLLFILCMLLLCLLFQKESRQTITYFPHTNTVDFSTYETNLQVTHKQTLEWSSFSETEQPTYLRQDVNLLFQDSKLVGVNNKWGENESKISHYQQIVYSPTSNYQAISLHFAEIHNGQIHSNYYISSASLPKQKQVSPPTISIQHLKTLAHHFSLDLNKYHASLLTNIDQLFKGKNKNIADQKKTFGQLLEGIYKNYVVKAQQIKQANFDNYEPIILFAKDHSHILVIYELEGERNMLIQQI